MHIYDIASVCALRMRYKWHTAVAIITRVVYAVPEWIMENARLITDLEPKMHVEPRIDKEKRVSIKLLSTLGKLHTQPA